MPEKNRPAFTSWRSLPSLLALCLMVSPAFAGVAEIVSLSGKGEYRGQSESTWREVKIKQSLDPGQFVRTGELSAMALLFADKTQMRLSQNSLFQVKEVDPKSGDATVSLRRGRAWMQSKSLPGSLKVETPSAIAAIHGTDWEMEVDDEGRARLIVLHGVVELYNGHGSVTVGNNEQAVAEEGKAPVKMLLQNSAERVQWVTSYTVDVTRYRELNAVALAGAGAEVAALRDIAALIRSRNMAQARKRLRELVQSPQLASSVIFLLLADFAIYSGDLRQADEILKQGKLRFSADPRLDAQLARVALYRDDAPAARQILQAAVARHPDAVELKLAQGEIARFDGDAKEAGAAYRAAIALAPQDARGWHGLGAVDGEKEEIKQARPNLIKALELDEKAPATRGELATLETFANNLDAARDHYDLALQAHPDDYVALTGLGLLQLKSGDTESALETLLKASVIEPKYARAVVYAAIAYYQLGRHRVALETLARASELDKRDPLPHQLAGLIHTDLVEPNEALIEVREALRLMPYLKSLNQLANDQKGAANLGNALAQFGLEDWARSYAMQSYDPLWAGSHFFLAERLTGQYSRNSELLQGYLADPTAIGASNRFQTLLPRPGQYADVSLRANRSDDFTSREPGIVANGYTLAPGFPMTYFFEGLRLDVAPGNARFDAGANTYTAALGLAPRHDWNVFLFANGTQPDVHDKTNPSREIHTDGSANRVEAGVTYRPRARESWWLKTGFTDYDADVDRVDQKGGAWRPYSSAKTSINRRDLQLRHTFDLGSDVDLTWGAEQARAAKPVDTLIFGTTPSIMRVKDDDESATLYASLVHRPVSGLLLQADLGWQEYDKQRSTTYSPINFKSPGFDFHQSDFNPRLGLAWQPDPGKVVRLAWQQWRRPASYTTLSPLSTAGIVLDDQTVLPGGELSRLRGQVEWEANADTFFNAFADYKEIANLGAPGNALNGGEDIADLNRLRSRDVLLNLANPEILETAPVFYQGRIVTSGIGISRRITGRLAGYANYLYTQSENTSAGYSDFKLPYLPRHRVGMGVTWTTDERLSLGSHWVYRSLRYIDEMHTGSLPGGWDMTLKAGWHSADKHLQVDAYAANLLKKDSANIVGINVEWRF
ncbi:MAG: TonB-dependent receptor [Sulfuricellaceae bacterium]